jgi:putative flippase GtrA
MHLLPYLERLIFRKTSVGIFNRWLRHLLAGGFGTLLYYAGVVFGVEILDLHPVTSAIIAFAFMELYFYFIQRLWVYRPLRAHSYCVPRYILVTIVALLLNTTLMYIAVETLSLNYIWGLAFTTLIIAPTNFLLNYFWAFK